MLALLAARFGDVDLADDAVQDALVRAVQTWERGVPDNPAGWLYAVAHHRMVDTLRRRSAADRRLAAAAPDLVAGSEQDLPEHDEDSPVRDDRPIGDERLRLLLLCCHPALNREAQVALMLRLVGGLTTAEIAAAFIVPEATLAQRIVRAKRKIREARIPLSVPADLSARMSSLLEVLYLIFNEGYLAREGNSGSLLRVDLADEAMRLTHLLSQLVPDDGEVLGLLALQRFHRARFASRVDHNGELVVLRDQDRTTWDASTIEAGKEALQAATRLEGVGPYRLQALIASIHSLTPTYEDTDWRSIVLLYRMLEKLTPGPVVALNRAIAMAEAHGAAVGLAAVDAIEGLDGYHLWHAARGEMLLRLGRRDDAQAAFLSALTVARNVTERRHLTRRLKETSSGTDRLPTGHPHDTTPTA